MPAALASQSGGITRKEPIVENIRPHSPEETTAVPGNRRSLLAKAFIGVATGVLPAALVNDATIAFSSLSGCKKKCNRFSGNCKSGCLKCCRKIFRGNKKSCSFGCGKIKPK